MAIGSTPQTKARVEIRHVEQISGMMSSSDDAICHFDSAASSHLLLADDHRFKLIEPGRALVNVIT